MKKLVLPTSQQPQYSTQLPDQLWYGKARKHWTPELFLKMVSDNDAKTLYQIILNDLVKNIGTPDLFLFPALFKIIKVRQINGDALLKELVEEKFALTGNRILPHTLDVLWGEKNFK